MKYPEAIAEKLNDLLEKNYDTEKTYRSAADQLDEGRLKSFLTEKALQRYDFGHQLKAEIRNFGEMPEKGSSMEGDIQRAWMNLKASFSGDEEEALLEGITDGEKAAVEEYDDILAEFNFPPSTENLLLKQRQAIYRTLEEVKGLS